MSTLRVNTIQNQPGSGLPSAGQLGVGQTWQNVAASRASGVPYVNNTGRPIMVAITANANTVVIVFSVDGLNIAENGISGTSNQRAHVCVVVPPGSTYQATITGAITYWNELR